MRKLYIFRDCLVDDGSGDIVFESLDGLKAHLLKQELDGLWVDIKEYDAETAVEEWDGADPIELVDDHYSTLYAGGEIEVRP